jgi:hypothetical protein
LYTLSVISREDSAVIRQHLSGLSESNPVYLLIAFSVWSSFFTYACSCGKSRNSSVGIVADYGMDDRMIGVRIPTGAGNFSFHHRIQTGTGAHPASYSVGTRVSFLGGTAAGAWSWPLTSV